MDFPSSDAMDVDESYGSAVPTPKDYHSNDAPDYAPFPSTASPLRDSSSYVEEDDLEPELEVSSSAPLSGLFKDFSPAHRGVRRSLDEDTSSMSIQRSMLFDTPAQPTHKKRRSLSPDRSGNIFCPPPLAPLEQEDSLESSPGLMSSPSVSKLERLQAKPLKALPIHLMHEHSHVAAKEPAPNANMFGKRTRRVALSEMIPPTTLFMEKNPKSARPVMEGEGEKSKSRRFVPPPARRAFSAAFPIGMHMMGTMNDADASDSLDSEVGDISSPAAAYAKRQAVKTIRRRDGTDDFRSMTGATAMLQRDNELRPSARKDEERVTADRETPRSKYLSAAGARAPGLGGFGDNEASGKILPCHRAKTDGLMRITWDTVSRGDSDVHYVRSSYIGS